MSKPAFTWIEFLAARRQMIRYFREVENKSWGRIASILSCDPEQVESIYLANTEKKEQE